jgi:hypothetical protein
MTVLKIGCLKFESEICAAGVAFVPGCRFAHPGYDMHLVTAMTILQDCHC